MSIFGTASRLLIILAALAGAFLVIGAVGVASWEYTNSDAFCSNACHDVHPEETYAHHISQHASVACVECHVGRLSTFEAMAVKATHVKHAWALLVGYERPLTSPSMPPSRKSCEGCHSEEPHQNNSIRLRPHFASDKENTKTEIAVILWTAESRDEAYEAIRWHLKTPVRYIATDPQKQYIPWIQVTRPDGSQVRYTDPEHPLPEEEVASSRVHEMDCIDCHNRSGHPFRNPEEVVDLALAKGKLDPRFPYVKVRVVELLRQDFETKEDAMRRVKEAWQKYQEDFPSVPHEYPEAWKEAQQFTEERQRFAADLLVRSKFLDPNVSWRSFPDHSGHQYAPGCFRCHSGRHRDADGNPLSVSCTLCHTVPAIIRQGQIPKTFLETLYFAKPPSHGQPYFMANHRTMVDDTCQACRGPRARHPRLHVHRAGWWSVCRQAPQADHAAAQEGLSGPTARLRRPFGSGPGLNCLCSVGVSPVTTAGVHCPPTRLRSSR